MSQIQQEGNRTGQTNGGNYAVVLEKSSKDALLNGLDEIGMTLTKKEKIKAFEIKHEGRQPWLFAKL